MRIILIIIACIALLAVVRGQQQQQQPRPATPQRYQMHAGEYEAGGKTGMVQRKGVFRIDAQTGRVWSYRELIRANGEAMSTWIPVAESGPLEP